MLNKFIDSSSLFHRIICMAILVLPVSVHANDNDEWTFSITPYMWATGQKGNVATLPPAGPIDLDVSFNDIIENLDIAFMGFVEARKGRVGIFGELLYVGISADAQTPGPFFSGVDYEQDLWEYSLGGMYQLTQNNNYQVDALLGFRFWDLDNTLKLKAGILPSQNVSYSENWFDWIIGLKGRININEQWYLSGLAMSAIAGDSNSYWDITAAIAYQYSEALSFKGGYRHHEVDYNEGDFLFDIKQSGPILGFTYNF